MGRGVGDTRAVRGVGGVRVVRGVGGPNVVVGGTNSEVKAAIVAFGIILVDKEF